MASERIKGVVTFSCDGCGEVLETDTGDFAEANQERKDAAWTARKDGEEWGHFCPDCA